MLNEILISIDVGIKNLGVCVFEINNNGKNEVILWKTLSITGITEDKHECCGYLKNKNKCKQNGIYILNNKYYCTRHKEINSKKIENIKAKDIGIIDLGKNIKSVLSVLNKEINRQIDYVIIENQLSSLAVKMKTIQGMIIQFYIMNNIENIDVISSQNKLKLCDILNITELSIDKKNYKERKKAGILITDYLINNKEEYKNMKNKFIGKKDDLADSFLQGLYYINKYKINNI
tara:strand:- start:1122 stop:1820 length:699 start_codon:yes stop_codon:yes gene_type:complete